MLDLLVYINVEIVNTYFYLIILLLFCSPFHIIALPCPSLCLSQLNRSSALALSEVLQEGLGIIHVHKRCIRDSIIFYGHRYNA